MFASKEWSLVSQVSLRKRNVQLLPTHGHHPRILMIRPEGHDSIDLSRVKQVLLEYVQTHSNVVAF